LRDESETHPRTEPHTLINLTFTGLDFFLALHGLDSRLGLSHFSLKTPDSSQPLNHQSHAPSSHWAQRLLQCLSEQGLPRIPDILAAIARPPLAVHSHHPSGEQFLL
ncbi:hypothetical protein O181_077817, partial [Austropuccinia psidii MF-1]|nr:hypothetical protein [Austropuccinia psidii MF-1]